MMTDDQAAQIAASVDGAYPNQAGNHREKLQAAILFTAGRGMIAPGPRLADGDGYPDEADAEDTLADTDPTLYEPGDAFDGWAVVEIMGHQRLAGRVRTATLGTAPVIRVDIPVGDEYVTRFFAISAIFSLSPVDERGARAVALHVDCDPSPIKRYELPVQKRDHVTADQVKIVLNAARRVDDDASAINDDEVVNRLAYDNKLDDGIPF